MAKAISNVLVKSRVACGKVRLQGYRSGLEVEVGEQLERYGITGCYETARFSFVDKRTYTPDFILPNGVVLEVKGYFDKGDRSKILKVKAQNPNIDIRFIFSNPDTKIAKTSKTTYGKWCEKNGFLYAKKEIPSNWLLSL